MSFWVCVLVCVLRNCFPLPGTWENVKLGHLVWSDGWLYVISIISLHTSVVILAYYVPLIAKGDLRNMLLSRARIQGLIFCFPLPNCWFSTDPGNTCPLMHQMGLFFLSQWLNRPLWESQTSPAIRVTMRLSSTWVCMGITTIAACSTPTGPTLKP